MIAVGGDKVATTRAGSLALSMLAMPLNATILEALSKGPKSLVGLRRAGAAPPTTTMQKHLRTLARAGVVEPRGRDVFSGTVNFGLTPAGQELLEVAAVLKAWLADAPDGELGFGTVEAAATVGTLVDGWSTGIVRLLAARPLSAAELDQIVKSIELASLQRRLRAMELAGLTELAPSSDPVVRHQPTRWLRQAIAPLAAAAQWEGKTGLEGATPISRLDVEAAFLLATPLVHLSSQLEGTCRLVVAVHPGGDSRHAGAVVTVERGNVALCTTRIHGQVDSWVAGTPSSWLHAVIDGEAECLDAGGSDRLSGALLEGLHRALFGQRQP